MGPNPVSYGLLTFTEEVCNEKLHFVCSGNYNHVFAFAPFKVNRIYRSNV